MTTLQEGELRITLPETASGRKFDGPAHGLSHCMKAVDWIIELPDRVYYIEVKDPDAQDATARPEREKHLEDLRAGRLDDALTGKFRDSFLYEWARGKDGKPISYYVVLACSALDDAQLQNRTDGLKRRLPAGLQPHWRRAIVQDCLVFNIEKWNRAFPRFPLERIQS